jgi:hypothetical protein
VLLSLAASAALVLSAGPATADASNVRLPPLDNGEQCQGHAAANLRQLLPTTMDVCCLHFFPPLVCGLAYGEQWRVALLF